MNKKNISFFTIIFLISCFIFLPLLQGHFATDSYNIVNVGYQKYATYWSLIDGRIAMYYITMLADKLNISMPQYIFITLLTGIFISCICVLVLKSIVQKFIKIKKLYHEIFLLSICYITIFNFMYFECFYFIEIIVMSFSVLLYLLAAYELIKGTKNCLTLSLILTIIGIFFYQASIGVYATFLTLFSLLKSDEKKQIIKTLAKGALICFIAAIANVLTIKLIESLSTLKQTRINNVIPSIENVLTIIIHTCGLFPKYSLLIYLGYFFFTHYIYTIKEKINSSSFLSAIALLLITILSCFAPSLITSSSFFAGRMRLNIGMLIGIYVIFLFVKTNLFKNKSILKNLSILAFISYVFVTISTYEYIMHAHKDLNKFEKQECIQISEYINEYEKITGNKITKIANIDARAFDKKHLYSSALGSSYTMNALRSSWSSNGVLNFYTGKNLTPIEITDEQQLELLDILYSTENGYICINDTLYIEIYHY